MQACPSSADDSAQSETTRKAHLARLLGRTRTHIEDSNIPHLVFARPGKPASLQQYAGPDKRGKVPVARVRSIDPVYTVPPAYTLSKPELLFVPGHHCSPCLPRGQDNHRINFDPRQ